MDYQRPQPTVWTDPPGRERGVAASPGDPSQTCRLEDRAAGRGRGGGDGKAHDSLVDGESASGVAEGLVDDEPGEDSGRDERDDPERPFRRLSPAERQRPGGRERYRRDLRRRVGRAPAPRRSRAPVAREPLPRT